MHLPSPLRHLAVSNKLLLRPSSVGCIAELEPRVYLLARSLAGRIPMLGAPSSGPDEDDCAVRAFAVKMGPDGFANREREHGRSLDRPSLISI